MKKLLIVVFTVALFLHNENAKLSVISCHPAISEYIAMTYSAFTESELKNNMLGIEQEIYSDTLAYMMNSPEYIQDIIKGRVKDIVFRIQPDHEETDE